MDIPVLKYIDVLIGLAVVMVMGTTLVAAVTQFILSSFYYRSRTLRMGLQELIRQVDAGVLGKADARMVAELLLRHPMLARPQGTVGSWLNKVHNAWRTRRGLLPLPGDNPTDVVQRSELVLMLLEWASGDGPLASQMGIPEDKAKALRESLRAMLVNNGIGDPAGTLRAVRMKALANERNNPAAPSHEWWNAALLEEASSEFLAKVNHSFDNTMQRITDAFKMKAGLITAVISFAVALGIQLDSITLVKRLSMDEKFRDALVAEGRRIAQTTPFSAGSTVGTPDEERAKAEEAKKEIEENLALMRKPVLAIIPGEVALSNLWKPTPGVILSGVLLSLGTPFWFNLLKRMLSLRSVLAHKDDQERAERASQLNAAERKADSPVALPPAARDDESGDLSATGAVG